MTETTAAAPAAADTTPALDPVLVDLAKQQLAAETALAEAADRLDKAEAEVDRLEDLVLDLGKQLAARVAALAGGAA
jgi:hypothetical protein